MARILGLDLGSYSVKAMLFESTARNHQVVAYREVLRGTEGASQETLRAALGEMLNREPLHADQVIIALPGPTLITHALSLPFSDTKRIEATLPFEVESQLPFDLSEAVFDYQLVGTSDKKGELIVGVVRKDELAALLALMQEFKLDPRVITHPAMAYQNLLVGASQLFEGTEGGAASAILDIGHERTSIAIGRPQEGIDFVRTFAGGGKDLSRALAAEFQATLAQANTWKEEHGALASKADGPDAVRGANAMVRGMQPVLRELRATLKAYTARTRRAVGWLHLAGGTSRLPGIDEQFAKDLGLPTRVMSLPNEAAAVPLEQQPSAAQSYALALRGQGSAARTARFNLRRREFAFKGDFEYLRGKLGKLAAMAAGLLILILASGFVRNSVLASRERKVDAMLCEVTQRVLGTCEKNYDRALNLLRGKESAAAAVPKVSAVNLLAELTRRVPQDVNATFDQIDVVLDRISVRGETESPKMLDQLTAGLKGYNCFKDVKQGKVERSKDGGKVGFRLDIHVDCGSPPPQG